MAYQLAYVLGHKNIVFIGQDLAFGKDGASHAKGHTIAQPDENLYITAYGGEGEVRTTYVWTLFKNQFEKFIKPNEQIVILSSFPHFIVDIFGIKNCGYNMKLKVIIKDISEYP